MRNLLIFIALLACVQCGQQSTSDVSDEGGSLDLQGHRGMRGLFPENSILGFLKALELGVNTLELDIVMSGDTQLVVSHEPFISSAICQYPGGKQIPKEMEKELNMYHMTYHRSRHLIVAHCSIMTFFCKKKAGFQNLY